MEILTFIRYDCLHIATYYASYQVFNNAVLISFLQSPLVNDLPKVDPKKACEYFDRSFKDPSTFTVVIIGNLDPAMIHPLILEYLVSLYFVC